MNFETVVGAIESLSGHQVNAQLRAYLREFPFPEDSRMVERDWVLAPQHMVEVFEEVMSRARGQWPAHFLPVGSNDNPDYFCVDLREHPLNVYQEGVVPDFVRVETFEAWLAGAWEEERSLIESEAEEDY